MADLSTPKCPECEGRGWHIGECHPRETCGICNGSGLVLKVGDTVHTNLLGPVTLVREMNRQSSIDGWEVRTEDGIRSFLDYVDFQLTELEVDEIRNALKRGSTHRVGGDT
jgi:hypothetical protein